MRRLALGLVCIATSGAADHRFEDRDAVAGAALYATHCASCHGANLEGQPDWRSPGPDGVLPAPPHDETGHTWHHDTDLLIEYTLLGGAAAMDARGVPGFNSGMPAFADVLSEDEVLEILAFIRASWPDAAKGVQRQRSHPGS